jgi:thiol-disulfide isomerase/thioredoxin
VLAAISVLAANREVGAEAVSLTLAYSVGAALPMLAIALGGRRFAAPLRKAWLRPALGGVVAAAALAIALGADRRFQTTVPGYTEAVQERVERSAAAERELRRLTGNEEVRPGQEARLGDYGRAPDFRGIAAWLNTPGERPLSLRVLRGKVVVIDFWTYSCINCLRTLPYLKAWDATYRQDGLAIVGVHTPEFAFEHELANVRRAARELGLRYPIAVDNDYGTWNAWGNRYWPAKYFVDRRGHVRFAHFGEGEYERSEEVIRQLLGETGAMATVGEADTASGAPVTPESYLGYERLDRYAGSPIRPDRMAEYRFPRIALPRDHLAYAGPWRVEGERVVASGLGARLRLQFHARDVHLVLGGRGTVGVSVDGRRRRTVRVTEDRLYTLVRLPKVSERLLELSFSQGVEAYAFTFG